MELGINELQRLLNTTLNQIKSAHGEDFKVDIKEDYYYHISMENLYKVEEIPKDFTIGSLFDDIEELKKVEIDGTYPMPYHLKKASSILRYIGETLL